MSNDYRAVAGGAPPAMKRYAASAGWQFPYLVDWDHSVGQSYGAVCTPDFFGLND